MVTALTRCSDILFFSNINLENKVFLTLITLEIEFVLYYIIVK